MAATYSVAALEAAHQSLADLIDAGSAAGYISICDSGDVELAHIVLDDPCGTVSAVTGQLTFAIATQEDSALASGTADYAAFCDSDDTEVFRLDCQAGSVAASGYLVLNTLTIIASGPVSVLSATVG